MRGAHAYVLDKTCGGSRLSAIEGAAARVRTKYLRIFDLAAREAVATEDARLSGWNIGDLYISTLAFEGIDRGPKVIIYRRPRGTEIRKRQNLEESHGGWNYTRRWDDIAGKLLFVGACCRSAHRIVDNACCFRRNHGSRVEG